MALLLIIISSLVSAAPAQAKPPTVKPKSQSIALGQSASLKIKSRKRCKVTNLKKAKISRRKNTYTITYKPKKTGTIKVHIKCGSKKLKAEIKITKPTTPVAPPGGPNAANSKLGSNLGAVTYYDGLVPFSNLMLQAGDWLDSFTARSDGYPASLNPGEQARVAVAEARYPAGSYRVSWQGDGSFSVGNQSFSGSDGNGSANLDGESLVMLSITRTNPSNPLHDIKILAPGESGLFRSSYLRQLKPYGILRFMDWQRTNGSFADPAPQLNCDNRTRIDSYSQGSRRGASVEVMVALANRTGAAPWFTIPHKADQSFISCIAQVVRDQLRNDLTPRFEYSNETWNPGFEQYHDLEAEGSNLGAGDGYLGLQRMHARRHRQAMETIEAIMQGRDFTKVISGQAANSWVMEQRLDFENAAAQVEEIAIAPYLGLHDAFEPQEASRISQLNQSELMAELSGKLDSEVKPWIESHQQLAAQQNKQLVAYEAGQHLAGEASNQQLTQLFTTANRSQAMGELYDRYFTLWDRLTGRAPIVHFTDVGPYTQFGSWGALESPDQHLSSSPKYQAILRQAGK